MLNRIGVGLGLLGCLLAGCITEPVSRQSMAMRRHKTASAEKGSPLADALARPGKGSMGEKLSAPWDWALAVPRSVPRAEVVRAAIAGNSLAALIPEYQESRAIPASAGRDASAFVITGVQGHAVKHCNQLNGAIEQALAAGKPIQVALLDENAIAHSSPLMVNVEPSALLALAQATAPEEPLMRVTEDGNQWVLVRQSGVRCKIMGRVERSRGLLQVVMSLGLCWGPEVQLPCEVRAACDGQPLQCLTAADALELLYGHQNHGESASDPSRGAFSTVSEREDYLMPTNYKRLQEAQAEARASTRVPSIPALATVAGLAYPGPAILGDARALAAFLLQKQIYQAGEPERISWLMFSGEALKKGETIQLTVDLGKGLINLPFSLPRSEPGTATATHRACNLSLLPLHPFP
jgi:hypothetical protein